MDFFHYFGIFRYLALVPGLFYLCRNKQRATDVAQTRADVARSRRDGEIARFESTLAGRDREQYIISLDATGLWLAMHDASLPETSRVTCVEAMQTYIRRAMRAQDQFECLAQVCFREAMLQAEHVDELIEARRAGEDQSQPKPLEGVPLSVKDDYEQEGFDCTCGLAMRCQRPYAKDGLMVSLLRDQGAIPFCRSATPQSLLLAETMSSAWGRTKNPWNTKRTSGGSSGGESALLSARASPLGIGSDIGGSSRNPASFCGLYAFKATPSTLSLLGTGEPGFRGESGQNAVRAISCPLGRSVRDLKLVLDAWQQTRMYSEDVTIPPLGAGWRSRWWCHSSRKLEKIGYYVDDGYFAPHTAYGRAVAETVQALRDAGHECIAWSPPLVTEAVGAYYTIMAADGCVGLVAGMEGEALAQEYRSLVLMTKVPRWLATLASRVLLPLVGEHRLAKLLEWCKSGRTAGELHEAHMQQQRCIAAWIESMRRAEIELVVCPGHALPAFLHGTSQDLTGACSYNFIFNLLGFPVGSVPVTRVSAEESSQPYFDPRYPHDDHMTRKAREVCRDSVGMPIGIQVIGLPFHDEQVLHLMSKLEQRIPFRESACSL